MLDILVHILLFLTAAVLCFGIAVELLKARVRRQDKLQGADGVDEMCEIRVNACSQWLHIRGKDRTKPILLMLHGGPGNPLMPVENVFRRGLEAHFVICHYDQRCAGKSYESGMASGIPPTLDLMVDDCLHITMYLKERFGREKIILLCHSWGTVLGTTLASRYPQHYLGYIGVGQLVDFIQNERLCYAAVFADAQKRRDPIAEEELRKIAPYPDAATIDAHKCMILRRHSTLYNFRKSKRGLRGAAHYVRSVLRSPEYSLRDTTVYAHSIFETYRLIFERDLAGYSAYRYSTQYQIPMFFISGEWDQMTPISLSRKFCETLRCPDKDFYTVAEAGHSPMLDCPSLFADIVVNRIFPRMMESEARLR